MSSLNAFVSTAEEMKSVESAWDAAPEGKKKEAARAHLDTAETARAAHREADCLIALSAATAALEQKD